MALAASLLCTACGDSGKAATMQLMKTEGTVRLLDDEGELLPAVENTRLYDGYDLTTAYRSYAWINLDSVKLTKLDASSEIKIQKSGKDLEILVNAGKLYFNITEPLTEEETLSIRTSTMAVGIRGTCGWVEAEDEDHLKVYVLEGTVEYRVKDPQGGKSKTSEVSGGEMAEVTLNGDGEISITVEPFTEEEVLPFVLEEVRRDEELQEKILEDSGLNLAGSSMGADPGNPSEQAADEIARILGDAARQEDSLRSRVDEAMERSADGAKPWEGDYTPSGASANSLIDNMLDGTLGQSGPWWMRELDALAADGAGENGLESVDYMQIRMSGTVNCYKPNIYIYGEPGTVFDVSFAEPVLLTRTIPAYAQGWRVEIAEDGNLIVDGREGYPFLFYESSTIPGIFQTERGFLVTAKDRAAQFSKILGDYGLNERETEDFIEFWDEMLEEDEDYAMYPQATELVDDAMPLEIDGGQVDHYFRLWFCFERVEGESAGDLAQPEIVPARHEGTSVVEWGGMILP